MGCASVVGCGLRVVGEGGPRGTQRVGTQRVGTQRVGTQRVARLPPHPRPVVVVHPINSRSIILSRSTRTAQTVPLQATFFSE